jgi:hypothetical protein
VPVPNIDPSAQRPPSTFYHVYRSQFGNYKVLLDDRTPSFYVNSRKFRNPDLTIYQGNGDFEREVANCKFLEFSSRYELNLFQEVNNKSSIVQTGMTRDGHLTASVPVRDANGATVSVRRPFVWEQTATMMLMDEETDEAAAIMHGLAVGLDKCFVLELKADYGYGFAVLVVTSAMAIFESQRRGQSESPMLSNGARRRARLGGLMSQNSMIGAAAGAGF